MFSKTKLIVNYCFDYLISIFSTLQLKQLRNSLSCVTSAPPLALLFAGLLR